MPITTAIQIRFSDVDLARHVHNAVYLQYFETGRMDLLRRLIGGEHDWTRTGLILARNEVDYLRPIHLSDRVVVETSCLKLGHKSFTLGYAILSRPHDQRRIHAKGLSVMVCYNYNEQKSIALPAAWRAGLEQLMEDRSDQEEHA